AVAASGFDEITQFTYDGTTGDLTQVTTPLGEIISVSNYDPLGDPGLFTVYPDTGNPATSTTPLSTSFSYDAAQMPVLITAPSNTRLETTFTDGVITQYRWYNLALPSTTLAQVNLSTDSRGRLYAASDLAGSLAQFKYDKRGNLTRIFDGAHSVAPNIYTQVTYGKNNEPTGLIWPGGKQITPTYDKGGRFSTTTDERGVVSRFTFDNANRFTGVTTDPWNGFLAQSVTVPSGGYDAAGRLQRIEPRDGTTLKDATQFTYEPTRKRLQNVATTLGSRTYNVSYDYYPDGKRHTMTSPAGVTTYTYDKAGRLKTLVSPAGETTTWSYDKAGRVTSEVTTTTAGQNVGTTYTYGPSGQTGDPSTAPVYLRTLTHTVNGTPLWTFTLKHSYLGQLLEQTGVGPTGESDYAAYGYDARGRLTGDSEQYQVGGATSTGGGVYNYDLANNLQGGPTDPSGAGGWSYNADNQATSARGGLSGGTGLTYDFAGNLTAINGKGLAWDPFGQLVSWTNTPSGTISFSYDYAGRRVSKTVGATGVTTHFLYNGSLLIAEVDAVTGTVT
ncbi:MAG: hypothetical protein C4321_10415, partial [Chloroflexota bacterium]